MADTSAEGPLSAKAKLLYGVGDVGNAVVNLAVPFILMTFHTIANRCTARTVDLPLLMMFRDGKTVAIPEERYEWRDSFVDCTRHLVSVLTEGGQPVLDGPDGKAVLQFTLAAHISAREGREVRPDEVR